MTQPPSPLRWILIPLGAIYVVAIVVMLFKFNPELMVQSSLVNKLSKQKSEQPIVTPDTSGKDITKEVKQAQSLYRGSFTRTNTAPNNIKMKHRILRAKVLEFDSADEDFRPLWVKDKNGFIGVMSSNTLVSYDDDLKVLWKFKASGEKTQILGPPVVTEEFVFVTTDRGKVFSLERNSGKLSWYLPLEQNILKKPILFKSHLFFPVLTPEGNHFEILKVHYATGKIIFRSEKLPQKPSSQASIDEKNELLFFGNMNGALIAMSTNSGKIKWRFEESPSPIRGAPSLIQGRLFAANDDGMAYGIDAKNGKKAWEYQLKSGSSGSFTAMPTTDWIAIMTDSGYMHVLDRDTGDGRWRYNTRNKKAYKTIVAMRLSGDSITELELLWRYKGWVLIAPCADTRLCFFNPKEGRIIHRVNLRGTLASNLVFDEADKSFFALIESGTGPKTFFEKSDDKIQLPKWTIGYFLQLKDFQRRAKALREQALTPKPEVTSEPATVGP